MKIQALAQDFAICKVAELPPPNKLGGVYFIGKTEEEISLVCETAYAPASTLACSSGWRAFRIQGVLDFSLVGVLSKISALLAAADIGIFAVSTHNTDYILTKAEHFGKALSVLEDGGYVIV